MIEKKHCHKPTGALPNSPAYVHEEGGGTPELSMYPTLPTPPTFSRAKSPSPDPAPHVQEDIGTTAKSPVSVVPLNVSKVESKHLSPSHDPIISVESEDEMIRSVNDNDNIAVSTHVPPPANSQPEELDAVNEPTETVDNNDKEVRNDTNDGTDTNKATNTNVIEPLEPIMTAL